MTTLDSDSRKEFRDYLWKYFALHADQRLKTFNFFIVIAGALTAAIVSSLVSPQRTQLTLALSLLLGLASYIFWQLDIRMKIMIKTAETALTVLDRATALPEHDDLIFLRIFEYERQLRASTSSGWRNLVNPNLSYSKCFNVVFMVFAAFSLSLAATEILYLLHR